MGWQLMIARAIVVTPGQHADSTQRWLRSADRPVDSATQLGPDTDHDGVFEKPLTCHLVPGTR